MAAGLGTRLKPFSDVLPKPLLPVLGVPTAQFALDALRSAGVTTVVANVHHLPDLTAQGLRNLDLGAMNLLISDERGELLGSAGGIKKAQAQLSNEPFFLLNSDVVCDVDLDALRLRHLDLRKRYGVTLTLAVFRKAPPGADYREIIVNPRTGLVESLGELRSEAPFFVGAAVLEPGAPAGVPASGPAEFVPSILRPAIERGLAGAWVTDGTWYDIGSPDLWMRAHLELLRQLETGERLPQNWRSRLESANRRVGHQAWIKKESLSRARFSRIAGPSYWSALETEDRAPKNLGPFGVLYGQAPAPDFERGIGFSGKFFRTNGS